MTTLRNQKIKVFSYACLTIASIVYEQMAYGEDLRDLDLASPSQLSIKVQPVKVAVIDSYFDPNSNTRSALTHSAELQFKGDDPSILTSLAHYYGEDHANHVASIILKTAETAQLRIIDLHHEPACIGLHNSNDRIIAGIDAAIRSKADFVNISLRLSPADNDNETISEAMIAAFLRAKEAGIGIIKSAGNDGEVTGATAYTQSLAKLLTLMSGSMLMAVATDDHHQICDFSNRAGIGARYIVAAPGYKIQARGAENKFIIMSGTSMAAPAVTGLAGLIKQEYPTLSSEEVLRVIRRSAQSDLTLMNKLPQITFGRGHINKEAALKLAAKMAENKY